MSDEETTDGTVDLSCHKWTRRQTRSLNMTDGATRLDDSLATRPAEARERISTTSRCDCADFQFPINLG